MIPVQITIKDTLISPALEERIREKTDKLHRLHQRMMISCRVLVESPQKHKHRGKLFSVNIDVSVPGKELVVNKKQDEDVYVALQEAFDAMERQLDEYSRKRHGRVKSHNGVTHGQVIRLFEEEGYGFIEDMEGTQYYFSMRNVGRALLSTFRIGDAVAFTPEFLQEGCHAHHVIKESRHY